MSTQQSHTFASRFKPAHRPKLLKECACPAQEEFQNIFCLALKKIKTPDTKADNADSRHILHDILTTDKEAHAHNNLSKNSIAILN